MIYQFVNKKIKLLSSIATSCVTHFCNQFNQVFALLISMSRFKTFIFIKIGLKLSPFCKKHKIF